MKVSGKSAAVTPATSVQAPISSTASNILCNFEAIDDAFDLVASLWADQYYEKHDSALTTRQLKNSTEK
jgi:hypothetical protein